VSVAELTGEIPIVKEDLPGPEAPTGDDAATEGTNELDADGRTTAEPISVEPESAEPESAEPTTAEPKSDEDDSVEPETGASEPVASEPVASEPVASEAVPEKRAALDVEDPDSESNAEQMTFDPVDESAVLLKLASDEKANGDASDPDPDLAELKTFLRASGGNPFTAEDVADDQIPAERVTDDDDPAGKFEPAADHAPTGKLAALWRGTLVVLQSILAVVFGAGLFVAFDQLWRWNNIVALVLSVLVILGLVVAVRVVRKTEDIASTLIAVAVGALVTLGPLALLQSV
jgi:hypothetical protein